MSSYAKLFSLDSTHTPGAHLEAIGLNQVTRAQDAVQPGQEPHRTRAEGPVLLRKRRGVQASVRRAVVGQRLQGEPGKRTKRDVTFGSEVQSGEA